MKFKQLFILKAYNSIHSNAVMLGEDNSTEVQFKFVPSDELIALIKSEVENSYNNRFTLCTKESEK